MAEPYNWKNDLEEYIRHGVRHRRLLLPPADRALAQLFRQLCRYGDGMIPPVKATDRFFSYRRIMNR